MTQEVNSEAEISQIQHLLPPKMVIYTEGIQDEISEGFVVLVSSWSTSSDYFSGTVVYIGPNSTCNWTIGSYYTTFKKEFFSIFKGKVTLTT